MGSGTVKLVALVPARGGSKGIPGKNIRLLCGKPLLYWVCAAAEACGDIAETYVSTDDPAIAEVARGLGLSKVRVIDRYPATATDTASTESVLIDFAGRVDFTHLALLQATSPLLGADALQQGCAMVVRGDFDSVLSGVRQKRFRWREEKDGAATPENYDPRTRPRRQEFPGDLVENGAFYVMTRALLDRDRCRLGGRIGVVEMEEASYTELDDLTDWTIVEALLSARLRAARGPVAERLRNIRFVCTDVDGCLTDAGMYYGNSGEELKRFSTRDGKGFELLREAGYLTGVITTERTILMERRAAKLQIDEVHQGARDKVAVMEEILARRGLRWEEVAFLGDDVGDLEVLRRVGLSAAPADAMAEVRGVVDLLLDVSGGAGAFRALSRVLLDER